jgi:hypothetical protein
MRTYSDLGVAKPSVADVPAVADPTARGADGKVHTQNLQVKVQ